MEIFAPAKRGCASCDREADRVYRKVGETSPKGPCSHVARMA